MELTTNRNYLGLLTGVTTGLKALKFVFFCPVKCLEDHPRRKQLVVSGNGSSNYPLVI
jgi:hypothetical protein